MKHNLFYYFCIAFLLLVLNYQEFYFAYMQSGSFLLTLYQIYIYFIISFFSVWLFSFSKLLMRIWVVLLFVIAIVEVHFISSMGIDINKQIIKNVMATDSREAFELLNYHFFIYLFVMFALLGVVWKVCIAKMEKNSMKSYFVGFFSLLFLFFVSTKINEPYYKHFIKRHTPKIAPINFFPALERYIDTKDREVQTVKRDISSAFEYDNNESEPLIVVFVIGESTRADRFSLNGYKKETNPLLSKESNLTSFKHATSCDTSTLSSVPCMVMRYTRKQFHFPVDETSFVDVFKKHGFDTYWITIQSEAKVIHNFCKEADECVDWKTKRYDSELLEKFYDVVKHAKKNTLVIFHTMGSHFDYNNRIPDSKKVFLPTYKNYDTAPKELRDNGYDNTIIAIDEFLEKIIDTLRDKNAFLIYSSDHGESLGEKQYGVFERNGHAAPYDIAPKEQLNVPFITWFSNKYLQTHRIPKLDKDTKNVSHDNLFSTVLGCSGFEGKYIDRKLDLCAKEYNGSVNLKE